MPMHAGQGLQKGTWGGEIIDELKPTKQDIVVDGKRTLDAFTPATSISSSGSTASRTWRSGLPYQRVCGRDGSPYDKGYKVFLLKDCCAAISGEEQKYVEEKFFPYIGEALTEDDGLISRGVDQRRRFLSPGETSATLLMACGGVQFPKNENQNFFRDWLFGSSFRFP